MAHGSVLPTMTPRLPAVAALVLAALLVGAQPGAAQATTPAGPAPATPSQASTASPAPEGTSTPNLDRIREGLSKTPALDLDEERLRFYASTVAEPPPSLERAFGSYDLVNGPRRGGPAFTHQEFLAMVTPQELYSQAGFGAAELLQSALVNWLSRSLIQKALDDLRNARTEEEARRIRERIDRELAELAARNNRAR
jgi:hypothetical protein